MDETDKIIIFTFSGATMLIGCLVITLACIFTPRQKKETTLDITQVTTVQNNISENANDITNITNNINTKENAPTMEQDRANQNIEDIDKIIQNFRESLSPDLDREGDEDEEDEDENDRNNIMLTFTPHVLLRGPDGEIYNPHQVSETDF